MSLALGPASGRWGVGWASQRRRGPARRAQRQESGTIPATPLDVRFAGALRNQRGEAGRHAQHGSTDKEARGQRAGAVQQ